MKNLQQLQQIMKQVHEMQEHLQKPDDPHILDFDAGIAD